MIASFVSRMCQRRERERTMASLSVAIDFEPTYRFSRIATTRHFPDVEREKGDTRNGTVSDFRCAHERQQKFSMPSPSFISEYDSIVLPERERTTRSHRSAGAQRRTRHFDLSTGLNEKCSPSFLLRDPLKCHFGLRLSSRRKPPFESMTRRCKNIRTALSTCLSR